MGDRHSGLRRAAALTAVVLLAAVVTPSPAQAESLDDARARVAAATDRLAALQPRVERALRAYDRSLRDLAGGVSRSISAAQDADLAERTEAAARAQENQRVRALYMTGGAALYATVLTAAGPTEALARVQYVQRLVSVGASLSASTSSSAEELRSRAGRLEAAATERIVTAGEVQRRYETVQAALDEARAELAALSERARSLQEARDLLAQIAALNAAVDASGSARVAAARAGDIPPLFESLYVAAAKTCRGMSWTLLAAIGQVESGHGANPGTSYAGAQGPMQFMPSTFAAYAVDGDKDGDRDIMDPTDSVFSAAHYLCANGAGRGGESLPRAIWHYNHADWYVQLVLKLAGQYAERTPKGGSSLG